MRGIHLYFDGGDDGSVYLEIGIDFFMMLPLKLDLVPNSQELLFPVWRTGEWVTTRWLAKSFYSTVFGAKYLLDGLESIDQQTNNRI